MEPSSIASSCPLEGLFLFMSRCTTLASTRLHDSVRHSPNLSYFLCRFHDDTSPWKPETQVGEEKRSTDAPAVVCVAFHGGFGELGKKVPVLQGGSWRNICGISGLDGDSLFRPRAWGRRDMEAGRISFAERTKRKGKKRGEFGLGVLKKREKPSGWKTHGTGIFSCLPAICPVL